MVKPLALLMREGGQRKAPKKGPNSRAAASVGRLSPSASTSCLPRGRGRLACPTKGTDTTNIFFIVVSALRLDGHGQRRDRATSNA